MAVLRSRREVLAGTLALGGVFLLPCSADATPADLAQAIAEVLGGKQAQQGRIKLEIPRLAESGLSVPLDVVVDSPMTREDFVETLYLFAERNPLPNIARFHMSPLTGRAQVITRIRLADTQMVTAIAKMSDGTFWQEQVEVVITIAACTEPA